MCAHCKTSPARPGGWFCSDAHKLRAWRRKRAGLAENSLNGPRGGARGRLRLSAPVVIHLSFSREQYWRLVGADKREGLTLVEWAKRVLNEVAGIKAPARSSDSRHDVGPASLQIQLDAVGGRVSGALEKKAPPSSGLVVQVHQSGLYLSPDISWDAWVGVGKQLGRSASRHAWAIGDWAWFGKGKWGKMYKEAVAVTSLDNGTIRDAAWVAGRFRLSWRNDNLSFAHHRLVASLSPPDAQEWLARAEREGWSYHEMRSELQAVKEPEEGERKPLGFPARVTLAFTTEERDQCLRAAELADLDFVLWAKQVLLDAAAKAA